jgi:glutamate dehydrogenase (NAD(P)+)
VSDPTGRGTTSLRNEPNLIYEQVDGQSVYTAVDREEILGFVVIDSTVAGRACGGLRFLPDIDRAEIQGLARAMTLKYGLVRLPQGGAKAGVIGDPESPQAQRLGTLTRFADCIASLLKSERFVPGTDMGTSNSDIRHLLAAARVRVQPKALRDDQSGYYTACSAFSAARQAGQHLGLSVEQCRVAIEGFGSVGRPLAKMFHELGSRVVAISTSRGTIYNDAGLDLERLCALYEGSGSHVVDAYPGAQRLSREELLELPVDILCPCARHNSIHSENASRIKTRIICPGANNPVTSEAEQALLSRKIMCLPDFVTNCGGVLGGTMAFASVKPAATRSLIQDFMGELVAWMLREANQTSRSPRQVIEPVAKRRFEDTRQAAANVSLRGRVFAAGLRLYREGLVPGALVAGLAMPFFKRQVSGEWSH